MTDFMFVVFAGLALLGGAIMAFHRSIVHSAFALVASLFGVAGLYWTLGADFLGATQVLLYVGGVTVLLLFAVMLTTRDSTRVSLGRNVLVAPLVGLLGVQVWQALQGVAAMVGARDAVVTADPGPTTEAIGTLFLQREHYLLPFEAISVLLLVVLVGAVTLARRGPDTETAEEIADEPVLAPAAGHGAHGGHGAHADPHAHGAPVAAAASAAAPGHGHGPAPAGGHH
jgi:NADH:ubiquinone oxidoreductase subunit 6 (subunit J)